MKSYQRMGIIGAMEVEIQTLRAAMTVDETRTVSGMTFYLGTLDGVSVVLAQSGVGKVFAAVAAEIMVTVFGADALVNTGVGGGIAEGLEIGEVVAATHLVQHDMDTTPIGDPPGLLSGINIVNLPCDEELRSRLENAMDALAIPHREGVIASGDQFISSTAQKERIRHLFGASVCEMEGAAIGQVAYINQIPCAVLRAVSDNGDDSARVDFPTFARASAEKSAQVIRKFLQDFSK